ncbi:hypothetical protein GCM10009828_018600 [Actinoplanes couchii]|uniref:Uncharacterized protein n=1 Tax=Actinoplanes couchii TaxID=403638 RepID=A0ABQ3XDY9_9ACTN|nr:hypothetical protein Aco03nite_051080 [Actinoplanes couchii]
MRPAGWSWAHTLIAEVRLSEVPGTGTGAADGPAAGPGPGPGPGTGTGTGTGTGRVWPTARMFATTAGVLCFLDGVDGLTSGGQAVLTAVRWSLPATLLPATALTLLLP